jgi:hypothetical protein
MSLLIIGEGILENEDRAPIRLDIANKVFYLTSIEVREYASKRLEKYGISFGDRLHPMSAYRL